MPSSRCSDAAQVVLQHHVAQRSSPSPSHTACTAYRTQLVALFQRFDAPRVAQVDALLQRFMGREAQLVQAVTRKYGVAPKALENDIREDILALLQQHDPSRAAHVDRMLAKYEGREKALFAALKKKYAAHSIATATAAACDAVEATAPQTERSPVNLIYKKRLSDFLSVYDPGKVPRVCSILRRYAGKEEMMMEALVKRFGPEPVPAAVNAASTEDNVTQLALSNLETPFAVRLRRFFAKYDPSKLHGNSVGLIAERHRNAPELLLEKLVRRYGPEPCSATESQTAEVTVARVPTSEAGNDAVSETAHDALSCSATVLGALEETSCHPLDAKERLAADASHIISLSCAEWHLSSEQQMDASRRLEAFFRRREPDAAQPVIGHSDHAGGVSCLIERVAQEELQQWREAKLGRADLLVWRQRRPVDMNGR